jgi:hypothetical protein
MAKLGGRLNQSLLRNLLKPTGTVLVEQLSGQVVLSSILEGVDTTGPVATFSDANTSDVASDFTATVNWGDGTNSAGSVDGTAATSTTVNGLYTISGNHTYGHPGTFQVTITASAPGTPSAVTTTTLNWHR